MPNYKIEKPEGAPDWFTPGIVCEVWNLPQLKYIYPVVWYAYRMFAIVSEDGELVWYSHAKPVERWVPEDGEIVLSVGPLQESDSMPIIEQAKDLYEDWTAYRFTDEVHDAIKAGILTVGWLRDHGEKYEP